MAVDTDQLTSPGSAVGTVSYMSLEQVLGKPLDARTDLFSFGVVLYEMTTGFLPFTGDSTGGVFDAILHKEPAEAVRLNTAVPAELERIIDKAIEKDRELRYHNATDLRTDLKRLKRDTSSGKRARASGELSGGVPAASGATATATASHSTVLTEEKPKRSRKWMGPTVIGVLLLAGIAAVGWNKFMKRPMEFNPQKMQFTKLTDSGRVGEIAISPEGRYIVYSQVDGEKQSLWMRNVASSSDVQILAPDDATFNGITFAPDGNYINFVRADKANAYYSYLYVMPVLGGQARQLVKDIDTPVSFSPDGKQFVYMRGVPQSLTVEVRVANSDGSANHVLASIPAFMVPKMDQGPAWSPDGKTIAVTALAHGKENAFVLRTIDVATGQVRELYRGKAYVGQPTWMLDGKSMIVALQGAAAAESLSASRRQLWSIAFPSGELKRLTNDLADYGGRTQLTKDGKEMVVTTRRMVSHIWHVPGGDGSKAKELTSGEVADSGVAAGPNGKILARSANGRITIMEADGTHRAPFSEDSNNFISLSSCGDRYVLFDRHLSSIQLWRYDADGQNGVQLADDALNSDCSPDGKWLLYFTGGRKLFRMPAEGGSPTEIVLHPSGVPADMRISPDGERIVFDYQEQTGTGFARKVAVAKSTGGALEHVLDFPGEAMALQWSPDGKGVQYLLTRNGATNVWEQRFAGGDPKPVTNFTSGTIFDFAWTHDGKTLLLAKGDSTQDVVLISHL